MGKVRKLRQKYHLSKAEQGKSAVKDDVQKNFDKRENEKLSGITFPSTENIFAGLDITYDSLTKSLPVDSDARSVISTKSRKEIKLEEQHLKKNVKMKLRRERFLQKLDVAHQAMKADREKKKKKGKKKTITDQPNPVLEVLPSLKSLLSDNRRKNNKEKKESKLKGIMKMKKRIKQQTNDTKLMKKILKDKKFRSNPGQTITDYLKQKVALER